MEKDLQITLTPLVEHCFFVLLALDGKIPKEQGEKMCDALKGKYTEEEIKKGLDTAKRMVDNVEKYGVPCEEWA